MAAARWRCCPDVAEMKSFTELKDEKRENERSGTDGKENGSKENPQNLQEEIQLSAGIYEFCYRTNRDYRKAYTMNSRLEEMQNDPRAMEILARKLPLAVDKINSQDPENLNLSLNELQYMFFWDLTRRWYKARPRSLCIWML